MNTVERPAADRAIDVSEYLWLVQARSCRPAEKLQRIKVIGIVDRDIKIPITL